jgi:hypothetical protein
MLHYNPEKELSKSFFSLISKTEQGADFDGIVVNLMAGSRRDASPTGV